MEVFSVDELKRQSWADYKEDGIDTKIQMLILKEPYGEIAQFEVLNNE